MRGRYQASPGVSVFSFCDPLAQCIGGMLPPHPPLCPSAPSAPSSTLLHPPLVLSNLPFSPPPPRLLTVCSDGHRDLVEDGLERHSRGSEGHHHALLPLGDRDALQLAALQRGERGMTDSE